MREPDRARMRGQVRGLAAPAPTGPVFVTSYYGRKFDTTVLTAVDPAGAVLWRREFDGHPGPPRVGPTGTVWMARRGPAGHVLAEVADDGKALRSVTPDQAPTSTLGRRRAAGRVLRGLASGAAPPRGSPGGAPRVARYTPVGATVWSTPVPFERISFPGVAGEEVDHGGVGELAGEDPLPAGPGGRHRTGQRPADEVPQPGGHTGEQGEQAGRGDQSASSRTIARTAPTAALLVDI